MSMTIMPMERLRPARSWRAGSLGIQPSLAIASSTRRRVGSATISGEFRTLETVPSETPASAATSFMLTVALRAAMRPFYSSLETLAGLSGIYRTARSESCEELYRSATQQCRGDKLPSILTVPGCCTTTSDHPSSAGRVQPLEADTYRDQRTRTTYSPGSGKDSVRETASRATT